MSKYTDKELLDFLDKEGMGIAVVHDDEQHWCVASDGYQSVVFDGPGNFDTNYLVPGKTFGRRTIREAIEAYMSDQDGYQEAINAAYIGASESREKGEPRAPSKCRTCDRVLPASETDKGATR